MYYALQLIEIVVVCLPLHVPVRRVEVNNGQRTDLGPVEEDMEMAQSQG